MKITNHKIMDSQDDLMLVEMPMPAVAKNLNKSLPDKNLDEVQRLELKLISHQDTLIDLQNYVNNQVATMINDMGEVLTVLRKLKKQENNVGSNGHSLEHDRIIYVPSTSKQPSNADQAAPSNSVRPRETKPADETAGPSKNRRKTEEVEEIFEVDQASQVTEEPETDNCSEYQPSESQCTSITENQTILDKRTGLGPEWFIDCSGLLEDMRRHVEAKWASISRSLSKEEKKKGEVLKNSILVDIICTTKDHLLVNDYKKLSQFTRDVTSSIEQVMSESEEKRMLLDQLGLQDFYDDHVAPIISKYSPSKTRTAKRREVSNVIEEDWDEPSPFKRLRSNEMENINIQLFASESDLTQLNIELSNNDDESSEYSSNDEQPPEVDESINQASNEQINNENGENRRSTARQNTRNIPAFSNVEYLELRDVFRSTQENIIGKVVSHRDRGEQMGRNQRPYKHFYFLLECGDAKTYKVNAWTTVYDKVHKKIKRGQVLRLQNLDIKFNDYTNKNELNILTSSIIHRWTRANEWKILLLPQ